MKILFFYNEEWEKDYFKKEVSQNDLEVDFLKGRIQDYPELKDNEVEILSIFVGSQIDALVLDKFPNLKYITTRSTGFDHIDLEEAEKRNIIVSNVPAYGSVTVAEFVFALLLTISRKIFPAYDQILEQGNFEKEGLRGFDLNKKVLGVVGIGKIGQHVISIAKGFGMEVLAVDVNQNEELAEERGFKYVEIDELLARADVITLHLPYNSRTHHVINKTSFEKMKKGVVIINTSRGGVMETQALVDALKNGTVAGAGLDVLEAEIYMGDELNLLRDENAKDEDLDTVLYNQYLIENPNVIITPHNAFNTQEAVKRILGTTIENVKEFGGGNIINKV